MQRQNSKRVQHLFPPEPCGEIYSLPKNVPETELKGFYS